MLLVIETVSHRRSDDLVLRVPAAEKRVPEMANTPTSMVNAVTGILHHRPPMRTSCS